VLTISSGTATITAGSATLQNVQNFISMGRDNATGIINLDGGTLATGRQFIRDGSAGGTAGAGSATFNFNGGVLQAQADQTSGNGWFETATTGTFQVVTTTVKAGGAKIDTNGFTTNINTVLAHDSSLGGTADGGLTKSGTGTLSLGGANTYTGNTTVTDGVLLLTNTSGSGTGLGDLSVGASGTVAGTGQIAPIGTASIAISGDVSPGGLPSAIGTLTFDLGATTGTGAILNGAELRFDLGTANPSPASISAGSSDTLSLAGASAGDLAFNATSVNFLGTGSTGYYKLFDTSFDATTWSGLSFDGTTGLVTTGLSGFNLTPGLFAEFIVGTATNGAESVGDIYVHVVPEPGSSLTLLAAGSLLGLTRRRQRRCCSGATWSLGRRRMPYRSRRDGNGGQPPA
jgi:autotransporter-associated beta strand protein